MTRSALWNLRRSYAIAKFGFAAICLLLFLVIVYVAWLRNQVSVVRENFAYVQLGQSRETVEAIMGRPDAIRTGSELFEIPADYGYGYVGDNGTTDSQYVYYIDTPYLPFIWFVGFDRSGVVVEKYAFE